MPTDYIFRSLLGLTQLFLFSRFTPYSYFVLVQLTSVFFGRRDAVKIRAHTQRRRETRLCWQTSAGPLSMKCRFGRAPRPVMAASVLQSSSAPCLMVKCSCLLLQKKTKKLSPLFFPFPLRFFFLLFLISILNPWTVFALHSSPVR